MGQLLYVKFLCNHIYGVSKLKYILFKNASLGQCCTWIPFTTEIQERSSQKSVSSVEFFPLLT